MSRFARISPTARFTAAVWARHGLSPPALQATGERWLARAMAATPRLQRALLLEDMLLARHRAIDRLLARAIGDGVIGQVVELAAGNSARGLRLRQRFGEALTYIETDLPRSVAEKRRRLAASGQLGAGHRLAVVDATAEAGPQALDSVLADLDPERGTALVSEGLLNYLPAEAVTGLWRRAARGLARFPASLYLADVYLEADNADRLTRAFLAGLGGVVRGRVRMSGRDADSLQAEAAACGWKQLRVLRPDAVLDDPALGHRPGARRVRLLAASAGDALPGLPA